MFKFCMDSCRHARLFDNFLHDALRRDARESRLRFHDQPVRNYRHGQFLDLFRRDEFQAVKQCQRLRSEGVVVVNGRVDMARFGWQRNLDAQLWGMP